MTIRSSIMGYFMLELCEASCMASIFDYLPRNYLTS